MLLSAFEFEKPATEDAIVSFENGEGFSLPKSYRDFLKIGNGGEGPIGEFGYAIFWRLEEIAILNRDYNVHEYLPGYLLIGSDGSGEAFAINLMSTEEYFVKIPFVGIGADKCIFMGQLLHGICQSHIPKAMNPKRHSDLRTKEIFHITPVILGGSPTDPENKIVLNRTEHIAAVNYWNKIIRDLKAVAK